MPKSNTAMEIATLLRRVERSLDQAYADCAALAGALPAARIAERQSAVVGQPVFEHVASALAGIGSTRGHVVSAHRAAERVAKALDMDVVAWGDEQPKPNGILADRPNLSVAA